MLPIATLMESDIEMRSRSSILQPIPVPSPDEQDDAMFLIIVAFSIIFVLVFVFILILLVRHFHLPNVIVCFRKLVTKGSSFFMQKIF